jgi:hypothetical protein
MPSLFLSSSLLKYHPLANPPQNLSLEIAHFNQIAPIPVRFQTTHNENSRKPTSSSKPTPHSSPLINLTVIAA